MQPPASPRGVKIVLTITGLTITFLGLVAGLILMLGVLLTPSAGTDSAIIAAAFMALGGVLGGAFTWQVGNALREMPSARFWLPPLWILLLIFIPALVIGQLLISFNLWPIITFPPVHVLAATLPSLAILAVVGRVLRPLKLRWREIITHLAGGAFLATTVAFTLEIVLGILLLLLVFAITAFLPGGSDLIDQFISDFQDATLIQDPASLSELLLSPPIAVSIILVVVVVAPLIEELAKVLGVMAMSYRRPIPARAFVWGVAAGAGFGLVENLLNTITGLEIWALVIVMRVGATLMHCLSSGLVGLGWQSFRAEGRLGKLLQAYGLGVLIHAAWNGAVVTIAGSALMATSPASSEMMESVGGWLVIGALLFLLFLAAAITIAFVGLTYRLRDRLPPVVDGTGGDDAGTPDPVLALP